jgi:hypothetical protein
MTYIYNFTNMDAAWKILNWKLKLLLKTHGYMDVACNTEAKVLLNLNLQAF